MVFGEERGQVWDGKKLKRGGSLKKGKKKKNPPTERHGGLKIFSYKNCLKRKK